LICYPIFYFITFFYYTYSSSVCCVFFRNFGDLYLWGWNVDGQLGLGHSNDIGDNANEMGQYLQLTDLGSGRTSLEFSGGERHSVSFFYQINLFNVFFGFKN